MKIVDYVVVGASSEVRNLELAVESAIKDGRQPFGGVSVDSVKEGGYGIIKSYYYQAMVKYEPEVCDETNDSIIKILYHQRGVLIEGLCKVQSRRMLDEVLLMIAKIDDKINGYMKK